MLDAQRVEGPDFLRHLLVAADDGGSHAAAHQRIAAPDIRGDLQQTDVFRIDLLGLNILQQRAHAFLPDRFGAPQQRLGAVNTLRGNAVEQACGFAPGLLLGIAADNVKANAKARRAPLGGGQRAHGFQLRRDLLRRLAPADPGVGLGGGDLLGRRAGTAKEHRRHGPRRRQQGGLLKLIVLAVKIERLAVISGMADAFKRGNKLAAAGVALIVIQSVAVATLLNRIAAGDDIDHQSPFGQPLEAGGLMGGQRR